MKIHLKTPNQRAPIPLCGAGLSRWTSCVISTTTRQENATCLKCLSIYKKGKAA